VQTIFLLVFNFAILSYSGSSRKFDARKKYVLQYLPISNFTIIVCRAAVELKNEAKSQALNHVNVVTLYAVVFEPKHYGVVLEFVPHGCLEEFVYRYQVILTL